MFELLREVWDKEVILRDWEQSMTESIFKQKGEVMECRNYRGMKLTEHDLIVSDRVLDEKL